MTPPGSGFDHLGAEGATLVNWVVGEGPSAGLHSPHSSAPGHCTPSRESSIKIVGGWMPARQRVLADGGGPRPGGGRGWMCRASWGCLKTGGGRGSARPASLSVSATFRVAGRYLAGPGGRGRLPGLVSG